MATAFASAASAQGSGGSTPAPPSAGASPASDPNAAAPMGAAGSVSPSAVSPNVTAETGGTSLGSVAGLAVVASGLVTLGEHAW